MGPKRCFHLVGVVHGRVDTLVDVGEGVSVVRMKVPGSNRDCG